MMRELVPFISCLVAPNEFEEALQSTYSEIYVATVGGYIKHMKLRGDRHIRLKVNELPKTKENIVPEVEINEELNFLPAGKIPYEYFEQIVHFFKEVMRLKKADMEAHAWILWSKAKGYYISVPKQTVSKASVQFSYDQETLPADSIIVVDIHSHNTMGAFYSGTDNNNDKNGVYYSGVVGKLDTPNPQVVFRFNMHETKLECKLADIFEMTAKEVTIPDEWMDQVEIKTYVPTHTPRYLGSGPTTPSLWDSTTYDITKNLGGYRGSLADAKNKYGNSMSSDLMDLINSDLEAQAEAHFHQSYGVLHTQNEENDDPVGGMEEHGEDYDYNCVQQGKEAADAKEMVDACLDLLAEWDDALLEVIRDAYELLGEKGKEDLSRNGI